MGQLQVLWLARIITEFGTFRIWLLILCPDTLRKKGAASQRQVEGVKIIPVGCWKVGTESHVPQGPVSLTACVYSGGRVVCPIASLEVSDLELQSWLSSCVNLVGFRASPFSSVSICEVRRLFPLKV